MYMGHIVSKNGVKANVKKVDAILLAPHPKNVKEVQSFLGGINYYSKYIPDMATIACPLYRLLQKNTEWKWTPTHQRAFNELKNKLTATPILMLYGKRLPLKLACDASSYGLGAVLSQGSPDNSEHPIAFASRTVNEHEKRYSQLDKEGAAIIFGLKKSNQYLF